MNGGGRCIRGHGRVRALLAVLLTAASGRSSGIFVITAQGDGGVPVGGRRAGGIRPG